MGLGITTVLIGVTAWLTVSPWGRVAFVTGSAVTTTVFLICAVWLLGTRPAVSRLWPALGGILPLAGCWLTPLAQPTIPDSMRSMTFDHARHTAHALHNYQDAYKHLPADIRNEANEPILSWRVSLLPFVEQPTLYRSFNLKQAWDGPDNRLLLEKNPSFYMSMYSEVHEREQTPWQGFVGPGTALETDGRKLSLREDFPDGMANTILIVEANQLVPWSKPADILYGPNVPLPSLGRTYYKKAPRPFPGGIPDPGFHVIMADGSVRFLSRDVSEDVLRAMIVRNDGR
jgi:hypothetical protein